MEDEKTPLEAVGELNWQRMITAALQFVGGGLVALNEQGSPAKAPEREDAQERDIRERLEGLGIRTHHADTIRRSWTSRPSPPPNVQARPIPTMSFEEFEAAVSQLDAAGGRPEPPQGANAPAKAQYAEPPRPEPLRPEPSHADGSGRSRAATIHNEHMELRLSALEAKVHEIRLLLMTLASAPATVSAAPASEPDATLDALPRAAHSSGSIATHPGATLGATRSAAQPLDGAALGIAARSGGRVAQAAAALGTAPTSNRVVAPSAALDEPPCAAPTSAGPAAGSGAPVIVEDRVDVEGRFVVPEAAGEYVGMRPAAQLADVARETVVQGPWASGRASPGDGAAGVSPEELGCVYDAHERRVAAIERTFESFESLVEGLAARPCGKGPPSE